MQPLIILGAGGYAQEVLWIVDEINAAGEAAGGAGPCWDFLGFLDPGRPSRKGNRHYDRPVLGGWEALEELPRDLYFACGIGAPEARRRECGEAERRQLRPATLVFPGVVRARHVQVGEGTVIGAGAILAPYARLGRHCALNLHATVGHDTRVGDFSVLCPGAQILGGARLGESVFIGTNATVLQERSVGDGATLGANSFLVTDLGPGQSAIGVPASVFSRVRRAPARARRRARRAESLEVNS
jgi:sugar O-acyltransferase (sialic acid O-acetyltransferase NeuD family)